MMQLMRREDVNMMRQPRISSVLQVALLTLSFAVAIHADEAGSISGTDFNAKLKYCKTCHGLNGEGYRGATIIPRLAGQHPEYLENQLKAFIERRRLNPFMFNVAHVLSPAMQTALAAHFAQLNPKPLGGASPDRAAAGKKIYEDGVPGSDVPPCAPCHGAEAKGDGQFPRLAGQLHDYMFNKLVKWSEERGQDKDNPDASAIMQPIAHNLKEEQILAVAAYLSSLE